MNCPTHLFNTDAFIPHHPPTFFTAAMWSDQQNYHQHLLRSFQGPIPPTLASQHLLSTLPTLFYPKLSMLPQPLMAGAPDPNFDDAIISLHAEATKPVSTPQTVTPPLTPLTNHPSMVLLSSNQNAPNNPRLVVTRLTNHSSALSGDKESKIGPLRRKHLPKFVEGQTACPLCGIKLELSLLEEHYKKELAQIEGCKLSRESNKRPSTSQRFDPVSSQDSKRNVLMRVRHNRVLRSTSNITAGLPTESITTLPAPGTSSPISASPKPSPSAPFSDSPELEQTCPICSEALSGDSRAMNAHVEACLVKQSGEEEGGSEVESSGEEFETYTWCGQTRVRATTMLPDYAASGFDTVRPSDEADDIDVEDDEAQFGQPQFSEADIIPVSSDGTAADARNEETLRKAVISNVKAFQSIPTGEDKSRLPDDDEEEVLKCLVCMDKYIEPLVSTQCWHVFCKECWLRTLGAKKLCPKCNLITSASDLRRIYL